MSEPSVDPGQGPADAAPVHGEAPASVAPPALVAEPGERAPGPGEEGSPAAERSEGTAAPAASGPPAETLIPSGGPPTETLPAPAETPPPAADAAPGAPPAASAPEPGEAREEPAPPPRGPSPEVAGFLGWLIPGAGHLYVGRPGRAVLYFVLVTATALLGEVLLRGQAVGIAYQTNHLVFAAELGTGAYTLVPLATSGIWGVPAAPDVERVAPDLVSRLDLGLYFTMLAGVLNLVIAHGALDLAASRRSAPDSAAGSGAGRSERERGTP